MALPFGEAYCAPGGDLTRIEGSGGWASVEEAGQALLNIGFQPETVAALTRNTVLAKARRTDRAALVAMLKERAEPKTEMPLFKLRRTHVRVGGAFFS